jgi:hypothetical protein
MVSAATLLITTIIAIWLNSFHNMRFPSLGTIRVIGAKAYGGDINTTQDGRQFIDWGTVNPGTSTNRSFYIKSESNTPVILILLDVTSMNITFQNSKGENITEIPPIEKPMSLTCNFNNTILEPNEEIYVTLTLTPSSDPDFVRFLVEKDVQKFSFDIIIIASEQQ